MNNKTLWAIRIQGPDDLIPVASYADALGISNAFNSWWQALRTEKPLQDYDPRMWAIPIEYDGDVEAHAKWVESPSSDYVPFIEAWKHHARSATRVEG